MSWALEFDGVNDYALFGSSITNAGDFEWVIRVKFNTVAVDNFIMGNTASSGNWIGWFSGALTARLFSTNFTFPTNPVAGVWYDLTLKRVSGLITFSEPTLGSDSNTNLGSVTWDQFGRFSTSSTLILDGQIEFVTLASTESNNDWDATASSHTSGTPVLIDTISGNDATGVNMPTDGSAWIDLGGSGITVTGQTTSFSYSAINAVVDLTGEISVTGLTASYNYQSISGLVDLTGEISVLGITPNYVYDSVSGVVELGAVISVIGQSPNYNYAGVNGVIELTGEININGSTPNYSYSALSGFVVIGEGQVIGTVTAGFADDLYSAAYKPSVITVNFKS